MSSSPSALVLKNPIIVSISNVEFLTSHDLDIEPPSDLVTVFLLWLPSVGLLVLSLNIQQLIVDDVKLEIEFLFGDDTVLVLREVLLRFIEKHFRLARFY